MSWLTLEPLAPARGYEFVVKVSILRWIERVLETRLSQLRHSGWIVSHDWVLPGWGGGLSRRAPRALERYRGRRG